MTSSQHQSKIEKLAAERNKKNETLFAISASKNDETWEKEDEELSDPTKLITIVEDEEEFAPEIEDLKKKAGKL